MQLVSKLTQLHVHASSRKECTLVPPSSVCGCSGCNGCSIYLNSQLLLIVRQNSFKVFLNQRGQSILRFMKIYITTMRTIVTRQTVQNISCSKYLVSCRVLSALSFSSFRNWVMLQLPLVSSDFFRLISMIELLYISVMLVTDHHLNQPASDIKTGHVDTQHIGRVVKMSQLGFFLVEFKYTAKQVKIEMFSQSMFFLET